jgi:hypothetical protein
MQGNPGRGPYTSDPKGSFEAAFDDAHGKARNDGHGSNTWFTVVKIEGKGSNPIRDYKVTIAPG